MIESSPSVPEWLGTGILTAAIAALAFVSRSIWDSISKAINTNRERKSRLVQLYSWLRSTQYSFKAQIKNCEELRRKLVAGGVNASLSTAGYEQLFTEKYATLEGETRELHSVIRGITIHALDDINTKMLKWLAEDDYFKVLKIGGKMHPLAEKLGMLEVHLTLWLAKYQVWIPSTEAHALVFLADEAKHGVGFPKGIEAVIEDYLGLSRPVNPPLSSREP